MALILFILVTGNQLWIAADTKWHRVTGTDVRSSSMSQSVASGSSEDLGTIDSCCNVEKRIKKTSTTLVLVGGFLIL